MNTDWKAVSARFHEAAALEGEARRHYLGRLAAEDPATASEIERLLRALDEQDEFLSRPPLTALEHAVAESQIPDPIPDGEVIGDFRVLGELGRGSSARVFRARQISLDRDVALKVSRLRGDEARNMANLEHEGIVSVFSESGHPEKGLRLICMQLVPGVSLDRLMASTSNPARAAGSGILAALDRGSATAALDPAALQDRQVLSGLDGPRVVAWLGHKLALALAHAHDRGVLHLDVKPANILVSPYGRPLLTDFNVSQRLGVDSGILGGTERYMAPEQKQALLAAREGRAVPPLTPGADVHSLGVVLREMSDAWAGPNDGTAARESLETVIGRCTAPAETRFASAAEVAEALQGCLDLASIWDGLPPLGRVGSWSLRSPLAAIIVFSLIPQLLGSAVNITYNSMRIVSGLSASQQTWFVRLCLLYNLVVYPICIALLVRAVGPVVSFLRKRGTGGLDSQRALRAHVLTLPLWVVLVVTLGWMPGSLLFPTAMDWLEGPLRPHVYAHFFVSFTLSWLIAMAYSFLHVEYLAFRIAYPRLWIGEARPRERARLELSRLGSSKHPFHFMAGFVPLVGAALVVYVGPDRLDPVSYASYRILVILLIGSGMAGLAFAIRATHALSETFLALTGTSEPGRPR